MTTMAQAIRAYVESGGKITADQIKRHINSQFPGQWKGSTLQAHLYACVANNPKAYIHHPWAEKFLYRNADGTFELYSESVHGPSEWAPAVADDEVTDVEELAKPQSVLSVTSKTTWRESFELARDHRRNTWALKPRCFSVDGVLDGLISLRPYHLAGKLVTDNRPAPFRLVSLRI